MYEYLFDLKTFGATARQASRSIWVLWIKKNVIYKFIKPHKNAAMLFFSNHTIKYRLDLS